VPRYKRPARVCDTQLVDTHTSSFFPLIVWLAVILYNAPLNYTSRKQTGDSVSSFLYGTRRPPPIQHLKFVDMFAYIILSDDTKEYLDTFCSFGVHVGMRNT